MPSRGQLLIMRECQFYDVCTCEQAQILPFTLITDGVFAVAAQADEECKFAVRQGAA